ncbi:response regulator [Dechloromonas sp. XY25]|uniref:histidine kinase n=1 Tax=Dechloromonas hankyongensis TaxID=2908002 RepID=A0ABS9K6C5_9RHOO|nr:response regulator [Dechloromonas hankyongensis]MCG2578706.1 response regulator [Dechloromonas hankyongensis]
MLTPSVGLRGRLVLILLVAFVALSGLIVWNSLIQHEEYRRAAGERLLNDARLLAARQQAVIARGDAVLNNAMLVTALRDKLAPGRCPRLFAEHLSAEPAFFGLGAAAADGSVLCATPGVGNGSNLADRSWFRQALAARAMVVSDVLDAAGPPRIMLGKALRDDAENVRGVFFLALDLRRFEQELLKSDLPAESHVAVIDSRGTVAVRFPDPEPQIDRHLLNPPLIQRMASETHEGIIATTDLDGVPALVAHTPLLQAGLGAHYQLVLSLPTEGIEAEARRHLFTSLAWALAILAATLVLIYLVSNYYLMRPIKALSHAARRVGSGDLAITADQAARDDEFAELWRSLEEMANALRVGTVSRDRLQIEMNNLKQAERRLQRSEMTLSQATHIARLGVWSTEQPDFDNFDRTPVQWSVEMYQLLGYQPEKLSQPTAGDFFARIHPDDRQAALDMALAALAEKRPWQMEYRVLLDDGSERMMMEVGEASFDPSGRPNSMLGAVMDITQQRRAEENVRDNTAKLRLALEGASAGSYEWNVETGTTSWSEELYTLCGVVADIDTTSFATWRKVIHPYDLERVEAIIETAVARQTGFEVEWRLNSPAGGEPHWVMERARPVCDKDGRVLRYLGIIIDITKQKQAELGLKSYREHLEEMVLARTAELSSAEAEQRRLNRALRLLGDCNVALMRATSEQQLLDDICTLVVDSGGYLAAWFGVAEQDQAKTIRLVAHSGNRADYPEQRLSWTENAGNNCEPTGLAIRSGTIQANQNCQPLRPWAGNAVQPHCQSVVALPIHNQDRIHGALTLYAAEAEAFGPEELGLLEELATNVSFGLQGLHARSELELYRQNLEQLVAERTREIGQLNIELAHRAEEAESANRAKSDFLATLSHEIRTPLNAVTGLTRLLADLLTDRRQRNYTDKIQNAAQVLCTLIDDILDFSKIEAGSLQLEQAPFALNAILQAAAAVVSGGIRGKDIEAFFDIGPGIPDTLVGDSLRLQQILLNLCSNAVKFTERGTIVISVRRLAGPAGQANLQFAVRDTGIGIPPEKLGHIFKVFTQADSSTSRKYGGTGLGLAISARLVDAMGGRLGVDSEPDQGSEFSFTVTLDLPATPAVPAEDSVLPSLRILIVDDHPLARDILQRTCAGFGWQATALDSAAAGLAALEACTADGNGYDLLLLDWHMPEINGMDMLKLARERPQIGLPLVVLMVPASELAQAVAAGDDLYLDGIVTKPLTPAALFDAVRQAYRGEPLQMPLLPGGEDRRLAGLRLLVAEDNDLNQEMVEQILTRAGAEVTLAANGQIAVDLLRAPDAHFDAVLMDIQMPVMDGYAATSAIRHLPGRSDLPIIAVTAHARPEDHEKSRQAGMAGHIVKPVDVDDLLTVLSAILPVSRGSNTSLMPESKGLPGLDLAAARRTALGRDPVAYAGLLRQFITHHGGDAERARELFAAGNSAEAIRLVHDLRGVAGYLKATNLARLAGSVETSLHDGLPGTDALFEELSQAMVTLRNAIDRFESGLIHDSEISPQP